MHVARGGPFALRTTRRTTWAFDADTHVIEEPDTWDSILPSIPSSQRLRIVTDRDGPWLMRGRKKLTTVPPLRPGEYDELKIQLCEDPLAYEKLMRARGARPDRSDPRLNDVRARLPIMDTMRVERAVLYPSLSLFWSLVIEEPDLADAHYAAWNTSIAQKTDGLRERLLPVAQYTFHNPKRTAAEIHRCRKRGLRALFVPAVPYRELPWEDASYEPIWNALEACDMALVLHFTVLRSTCVDPVWEKKLEPRHKGHPIQTFINRALPAEAALTSLILGGVLERHPRLRIGVIEFGSIWVPSFLHRLDYTFDFMTTRNRYLRERLPMPPSEYFRRQVKVSTSWNEPLEWLIRSTGDNILMFASDFPHPEGNGKAVALAQTSVSKLPRKTQQRFFEGNARELFGF